MLQRWHRVADCRWFLAVPFITRLMIFIFYNITITLLFPCSLLIIFAVLALITVVVELFKHSLRSHQVDLIVYGGLFACLIASVIVSDFLDDTRTWLYCLMVLMVIAFVFYTAISVIYPIIGHRLRCLVKVCVSSKYVEIKCYLKVFCTIIIVHFILSL